MSYTMEPAGELKNKGPICYKLDSQGTYQKLQDMMLYPCSFYHTRLNPLPGQHSFIEIQTLTPNGQGI